MDDNLTITNQKFADILFKDVFDEFISYAKSYGKIFFKNTTLQKYYIEKDYQNIFVKQTNYHLIY